MSCLVFDSCSKETYIRSGSVTLKIRLDRLVLLVEMGQVGNEILDDVGVRQRVQLDIAGAFGRDTAYEIFVSVSSLSLG